MKRAGLALVLILLSAMPALAEIATVVSVSPLTLTSSEIHASNAMQAKVTFCGQDVRQWASSMNVFMTGIPTGDAVKGIMVRVYPRPLPGAEKMYGTRSEDLPATVDLKDRRLFELDREKAGTCGPDGAGSYYYEFDPNIYPGPGAVRFYALIKNGKRWELKLVWFIGLVKKSSSVQMTSVFEYTTAPWSGPTPDPGYLRVMMERAGAGGRGGEYEDLALEEWGKQKAIADAKPPVIPEKPKMTSQERIREFATVAESPETGSHLIKMPVYFSGDYASLGMIISRPDGKTVGYVVTTGTQTVELPVGSNKIELMVDYWGKVTKKAPHSVEIKDYTESIEITVSQQGGGAR